MKNKKQYILIIISIIIFTLLAILYKTNNIAIFDKRIYDFITKYKNPYLTSFFKIITFLSSSYFIISTLIILLLILRKNHLGLKIFINILICYLINQILKNIFKRPRPLNINLINEKGYSFPSGHSMISLSFYGFIIYLINTKDINKYIKILITIILSILICLIGLSRIYLGVHYASDVLAGFAISLAHLSIYTTYYEKIG